MKDGSIRQRGQSWQLRITRGGRTLTRTIPPEGGQRVGKRQALDVMQELRVELDTLHPKARQHTVASTLEAYVVAHGPHWSPGTAREHRRIIDHYLIPRLGELRLSTLVREPQLINEAYAHLRRNGGRNGRPLSESTLARIHVVLRAACQLAVQYRWLTYNPAALAVRPRPAEPEPEAPDVADVQQVLDALTADRLLHALVWLDANTGARRGELAALRWRHVNLDAATVRFERAISIGGAGVGLVEKDTKTKTTRVVTLGTQTAAAMKAWRAERAATALAVGWSGRLDDSYVFATGDPPWLTPPWPSTISRRLRLLRDRHNLPPVTLLALRHFVATRLLDGGESVKTTQARVGHSRGSTTLDKYAASVPASDQRAADLLDALLT